MRTTWPYPAIRLLAAGISPVPERRLAQRTATLLFLPASE